MRIYKKCKLIVLIFSTLFLVKRHVTSHVIGAYILFNTYVMECFLFLLCTADLSENCHKIVVLHGKHEFSLVFVLFVR